jgi:DNA invertase Pin-like site-specific DNA recombinase
MDAKTNIKKKRVAAYARVSTLSEEQSESYETQVNYYTNYIKSNENWEFVKVYSDKGISGLSAEKRLGFMSMIEDAKNKKMDLILVKSISRFARNVVEAQKYLRELKMFDVEVKFERENISSFDQTADMTFNMLAAVAQEESRAISERVKWANNKRVEQGIRRLGNGKIIGYDEIDGVLIPNKDSWLVVEVFKKYVQGETYKSIVECINKELNYDLLTIPIVRYMLKNEVYVGDRLIQKRPPQNYITKRPDKNASYKSYYITDDHKPIISRKLWIEAQNKIALKGSREESHFMFGKIYCASCGAVMKRKKTTKKGEDVYVWKCSDRLKGKKGNGCKNKFILEEDLLDEIKLKFNWRKMFENKFNQKVQRIYVGEKIKFKLYR